MDNSLAALYFNTPFKQLKSLITKSFRSTEIQLMRSKWEFCILDGVIKVGNLSTKNKANINLNHKFLFRLRLQNT